MATLNDVKQTGEFMFGAINRCQDYAKISRGMKMTPSYSTFVLQTALDQAIKLFGKSCYDDRVRILPLPSSLCPCIITDKHWLQENIMCLISNAIKYSAMGEVTVNVKLQGFEGDGDAQKVSLVFEVEDHGVGIADEMKPSLFGAFTRAQRHAGGTGLGLYSLAQRVEALNGSYGVSNRRDGQPGSLFWFAIPYRPDFASAEEISTPAAGLFINNTQDEERSAAMHSPSTPVIGYFSSNIDATTYVAAKTAPSRSGSECDSEVSTSNSIQLSFKSLSFMMGSSSTAVSPIMQSKDSTDPLHVLLVDDSAFILKMMNRVLKQAGCKVTQAMNGVEALAALQSNGSFDVMIIDLHMPVLDGLETIRRVRSQEQKTGNLSSSSNNVRSQLNSPGGRQIIVGCSANGDEDTIKETLDAGADRFIVKPFNLDTFRQCLKELQVI